MQEGKLTPASEKQFLALRLLPSLAQAVQNTGFGTD
jgi:hypothetical protein